MRPTEARVIHAGLMAAATFLATATATDGLSRYGAAALAALLAWVGGRYAGALTLILIVICMALRGQAGFEAGTWAGVGLWLLATLLNRYAFPEDQGYDGYPEGMTYPHGSAQLPARPHVTLMTGAALNVPAPETQAPESEPEPEIHDPFSGVYIFEVEVAREGMIQEIMNYPFAPSRDELRRMSLQELSHLEDEFTMLERVAAAFDDEDDDGY